ncbi:hypothetical protein H310_01728 [Aphanomyces invadans]|uniref:Major facilitator superfamily (MFS) profile domain-containing protein n=1 Tax=Aphanomyces invadans TaxID=157072 RepID=A0A024US98_9STRA|nr:hypothetical protein H310_01728 [Aphanomyces invadans]ETW09366.1 hypothetical protein H310_01728 [Aphanomyces invadans]RHY34884.1 hypothetical protein DYB32_002402 [Aphanomyces invadans]|eukprot:XP_008863171.1 hypothetical protein H310_01728 [Aphanomyces invadans]
MASSKPTSLKYEAIQGEDEVVEVVGLNGIPLSVLNEIKHHKVFITGSLVVLEASVMWAYFSCLSAQDYYKKAFPSVNFDFLTTPLLTWPLVIGHVLQAGFHLRISYKNRVAIGYFLFAWAAIVIIAQDFLTLDSTVAAYAVLASFACVGIAHSVVEPAFYLLAALFPDEDSTHAVQVGNVSAGVMNIALSTVIRVFVGGFDLNESQTSVKLSFYIFMGVLLVVCVIALVVFHYLEALPCVKYLLDRADDDHAKYGDPSPAEVWSKYWRVAKVIMLPMVAQFMLFFCSLALFPGVGCASSVHVLDPSSIPASWFCSPGIIASFNIGDFLGRIVCTKAVYSAFSLHACFYISLLRWLWLPLLLLGTHSSSLYAFDGIAVVGLYWELILNVLLGFTGGMFSTITMGLAPRIVAQEDREAAGSLMVFSLFLGLAVGSTFGYVIGTYHFASIGL